MSEFERSQSTPGHQSLVPGQSRVERASRLRPPSSLDEYRKHWNRGERMSVETFLERFLPGGVESNELLDLIYGEVVLREEHGESPQLDEYLSRFPEHAATLRSQFEVHQFLRTSASISLRLSSSSFDSSDSSSDPLSEEIDAAMARDSSRKPLIAASITGAALEAGARGNLAAEPPGANDPSWPHVEGFHIQGVLGSGGMGTVYRAFDQKSGRPVALKTLNRFAPSTLLRFKREFRTLLDVAHPNLVTLYELIGEGQNWFLTMELLDGVDFLRYVRSDGTSIAPAGQSQTTAQRSRLRAAMRQLADGIVTLHAASKLHRDIKPSNVIVTREGRVVLLDFGLADDQDPDSDFKSTEEHFVGTAAYMAPEQAANPPATAASDWYSMGVMLFEALTGRLPFLGNALSVLLDKQRFEPPAPGELAAEVPEDLNALCIDLLRRHPNDRPSGQEVVRRLGSDGAAPEPRLHETGSHPKSPPAPKQPITLVGRERHRQALEAAFEAMRLGRTVAVYLHGPSGAGKTALLQNFLDRRLETGDAAILAGRCYERESVPYKALDSLIDSLGRHLKRMPVAEAAAVLPRDVGALARVFPSLRRVEAVVQSSRRGFASPDPQELRRRAFAALRELLARLGDRTSLVLAIDDLQWGDVDSAALLVELLRPPDAPVLLFLGTYRSEDRETSPFLRAVFDAQGLSKNQNQTSSSESRLDCRVLAVELLAHEEASALASALLKESESSNATDRLDLVEAIARESRGNPFFVAELARHVQADARDQREPAAERSAPLSETAELSKLALDEVLWARIERLPEEPRRVLELIAISGRPLRLAELSRCAQLAQDERVALAILRAGRLIRSTGGVETDEVETYHDRIRETVVNRLAPDVARSHHHLLANVLEASGHADPEVLGLHFLGAGLADRAADYFIAAADQAAEALAFERAVFLYRRALELKPSPSNEASLRARLGDALASAGRGAEAAAAYLQAVAHATDADAVELQRRAAMQFLISGHIDDGLATLETVLAAVDMSLPRTPLQSLVSLLWRRLRLRIRRLGFRERNITEIAPAELTRIDVCWSAGVGLSVVDTIRGADFQARGLLLALDAGEPSRIARSLAMEVAHRASTGGPNEKTGAQLLRMADDLARRVNDPYAIAMVTLARGVAAYLEGHWCEAQKNCDRAETIFRDQCTGVAWELDTANAFALWGLSHQGAVAELSRRWPILLAQARERGDLYAVMNLSSYLMSVVRLAANDPKTARAQLRETMAQWSRQGYHVQHNDALWAGVQIELYCNAGQAAWNLIQQSWPALRRSLLLRVQFIRTSMYFLRARAALAAAADRQRDSKPAQARELLAVAAHAAGELERERMPCPSAYAALIRGGLAALFGDSARAANLLAAAALQLENVDMQLCAAAARRRLGELIGGDLGRDAIARADRWMTDQKIENPASMASMILPPLT